MSRWLPFALVLSAGVLGAGALAASPSPSRSPAPHAAAASAPASPPAAATSAPKVQHPNLPYLRTYPDACSVTASIQLASLPSDVRAIGLVLGAAGDAKSDGSGELKANSTCNDGPVVREIPRAVFDAATQAKVDDVLWLDVPLHAPVVTCGKRYSLRMCARMNDGSLAEGANQVGTAAYVDILRDGAEFRETVTTPSGPIVRSSLVKGAVVVGYDPATSRRVTTKVLGFAAGKRTARVAIELADGKRLVASVGTSFFVPANKAFRSAKQIAVGDELLSEAGPVRVARVTTTTDFPNVLSDVDVAYPDAYFAAGVLVQDARPNAKAPATPLPEYTPAPEDFSLRPAAESFDCGLTLTFEAPRVWPADTTAFAWIVAPHNGAMSERHVTSCSAGKKLLEIPRSLFDAAHAALGKDAVVFRGEDWSTPGGKVTCDQGYDVLACASRAGAWVRPDGLARYGLAGSTCFVAGTMITTPDGAVPIEQLRTDSLVTSWDPAHGQKGVAHVRHIRTTRSERLIRLEVGVGVGVASVNASGAGAKSPSGPSEPTIIEATPEHPFYLPRLQVFRVASELRSGDWLLTQDGTEVELRARSEREANVEVYNLSVDGPHTYFAGGTLVHNY